MLVSVEIYKVFRSNMASQELDFSSPLIDIDVLIVMGISWKLYFILRKVKHFNYIILSLIFMC